MELHTQNELSTFDEFERALGVKVRHLRERREWSQAKLARHLSDLGLEMHQTTVAKMEAGRRPIRVSEAAAVAQALGVPVDALLDPTVAGDSIEFGRPVKLPQQLWTNQQTAEYLGVPVQTLAKWRLDGAAPRGFRVGKYLRYDPADIADWLEARRDPQ